MRKTLILTLVLCVFASFAYAQTGGTGTATTTTTTTAPATTGTGAATTTTTTTKHGKHHAAKAKKYKGTVSGVDQTAKSFKVSSTPTSTDLLVLKVNDKTKYYPKGKGWDDVKDGAKVWGGYKNDGTDNWATTVYFAKEKAAPPAKTGK